MHGPGGTAAAGRGSHGRKVSLEQLDPLNRHRRSRSKSGAAPKMGVRWSEPMLSNEMPPVGGYGPQRGQWEVQWRQELSFASERVPLDRSVATGGHRHHHHHTGEGASRAGGRRDGRGGSAGGAGDSHTSCWARVAVYARAPPPRRHKTGADGAAGKGGGGGVAAGAGGAVEDEEDEEDLKQLQRDQQEQMDPAAQRQLLVPLM